MKYFVLITGLFFAGTGMFLFWRNHQPLVAVSGILFGASCALVGFWDIVQPRLKQARHAAFLGQDQLPRTLVVKCDIAPFVIYALGSGSFAGLGIVMIVTAQNVFLGCVVVAFFGPGALLLAWQVIDLRPRLIIDSDGVIDRTLGVGRIDWSDIKSAHLQSVGEADFISLILHDPDKYLNRMSWLKRKLARANSAMGFNDVNLNLAGITIPPEEVLQLVTGYVLKYQIAREDA